SNRRIHSRRKASVAARLTRQVDSVDGTIENIGEGGVFFATEDLELQVEEGSEVVLGFRCRQHGTDTTIQRAGCVLRTERYFDGESVVRAFAIKFDEVMSLDGLDFE